MTTEVLGYTVTIKKKWRRREVIDGDWGVQEETGEGASRVVTRDYLPNREEWRVHETDLYAQEIDEIDLPRIIAAVNKLEVAP